LRRAPRVARFGRELEPPRAVAGRGAGSPSSDSTCSMLGRLVSSCAGSACTSWYSAMPIGLLVSRRAYSATTLSLLLHNKRPIVGASSGAFTGLSTAVLAFSLDGLPHLDVVHEHRARPAVLERVPRVREPRFAVLQLGEEEQIVPPGQFANRLLVIGEFGQASENARM
jgi:hypothetical protein